MFDNHCLSQMQLEMVCVHHFLSLLCPPSTLSLGFLGCEAQVNVMKNTRISKHESHKVSWNNLGALMAMICVRNKLIGKPLVSYLRGQRTIFIQLNLG